MVQRFLGVPITRTATLISGGDCVRPPIGQALAEDAAKGLIGALGVRHVAVIVAEVELAAVAAQMRL